MKDEAAVRTLLALGHATRLATLRLLAGAPDGLMASALAETLAVPRNALSPHLKVLAGAGLVTAVRAGRTITYRLDERALDDAATLVGRIAEA